jgi:hypothetical protein
MVRILFRLYVVAFVLAIVAQLVMALLRRVFSRPRRLAAIAR